jgi:hypothetical protein
MPLLRNKEADADSERPNAQPRSVTFRRSVAGLVVACRSGLELLQTRMLSCGGALCGGPGGAT